MSQPRRTPRSPGGASLSVRWDRSEPWGSPACWAAEEDRTAGSGTTDSGGGTDTSGGSGTGTGTSQTCSVVPEETAGPYPADGSSASNASYNVLALSGIVREDIRKSIGASGNVDGVPLSISITLTGTRSGCAALAGYAVYLWHCSQEGNYSVYTERSIAANYLRGVQVTDAGGTVTFTTVVPGCYAGRMPHMHLEIYPSLALATTASNSVKTTQARVSDRHPRRHLRGAPGLQRQRAEPGLHELRHGQRLQRRLRTADDHDGQRWRRWLHRHRHDFHRGLSMSPAGRKPCDSRALAAPPPRHLPPHHDHHHTSAFPPATYSCLGSRSPRGLPVRRNRCSSAASARRTRTATSPPEAYAACKDQAEGASVTLSMPDGRKLQGTCRTMNGTLVAMPAGGPPGAGGPPPAR